MFTPNIPDFYFDHENAGNFRTANPEANLTTLSPYITYIFTIPAVSAERDCSGAVMAMQFCYEYGGNDENLGTVISEFEFLSLTRNGLDFTVIDSFTVQTTVSERVCTDDLPEDVQRVCCSYGISEGSPELNIPSSEYIFGLALTGDVFRLLAFNPSASEYNFDQFQVAGFSPPPGTTTPLSNGTLETAHSLPLLRFFTGTYMILI